jgi:hypothetical protein
MEIRAFNSNGDSIADWRIQKSSETPDIMVFRSIAICDSFIAISSCTEVRIIDRFSSITLK